MNWKRLMAGFALVGLCLSWTPATQARGFNDFEGCYRTCDGAYAVCGSFCFNTGDLDTCHESCEIGFQNCVVGCNDLYPVELYQ